MNYKPKRRINLSPLNVILIAFASGIITQLILAIVSTALIEQGSMAENSTAITSIIIKNIGVAVATITAWMISVESKFKNCLYAIIMLIIVPVVPALLFWGANLVQLGMNAAFSVAVFMVIVWGLSIAGNNKKSRFPLMRYR